ncbi:MAG: ECF transporter S component [Geodermatophilaceae bacterium]|jgi:energy-coupling factor transport system substrate-specific component|nr:ECF transporter S component [Geodermatophilaceae bacterium]
MSTSSKSGPTHGGATDADTLTTDNQPTDSRAVVERESDVGPQSRPWRTVDIVVTAVIGVAFGVVFWAWNLLWSATGPAFAAFPPAQAFMYGVWLLPAVLAPMIVRKPGAAVFAETLAAVVSTLFGSPFGVAIILYGLAQGAAGEFGFAIFRYRRFTWSSALLAGLFAGAMAALLDLVLYYPTWAGTWQLTYVSLVAASTLVIAGVGAVLLSRALAATGALSQFASGRTRS